MHWFFWYCNTAISKRLLCLSMRSKTLILRKTKIQEIHFKKYSNLQKHFGRYNFSCTHITSFMYLFANCFVLTKPLKIYKKKNLKWQLLSLKGELIKVNTLKNKATAKLLFVVKLADKTLKIACLNMRICKVYSFNGEDIRRIYQGNVHDVIPCVIF